VLYIENLRYS